MRTRYVAWCLLFLACPLTMAVGADWGLRPGTVELKSVGPLAFGPDGVLFVSDPMEATIYAVDPGAGENASSSTKLEVKDLQKKLEELVGAPAEVVDLAVSPSGEAILAVKGKSPALVKVDASGKLSQIDLKKIPSSLVSLPNAPADQVTKRGNQRNDTVTDIAYINGRLLVAGASSGDASSTVREIVFPFDAADEGINVEIFHAAHGRVENQAVVRTFVPITIGGEPSVLAGFTCTPLVQFPLKSLAGKGEKVRGKTVAELGNRNKPLDIIVYEKEGKTYLLMANTVRGVMKISTDDIEKNQGLSEPVGGGGTAGQAFEKIESLQGVVQLDKLNDQSAVVVVQRDNGLDLQTIALP